MPLDGAAGPARQPIRSTHPSRQVGLLLILAAVGLASLFALGIIVKILLVQVLVSL
ncbi:MAG: hypothetical protein HHJ14_02265 [Cellulomonas sp.]|nr:hypothetical protein [Cellulomonas sp.]